MTSSSSNAQRSRAHLATARQLTWRQCLNISVLNLPLLKARGIRMGERGAADRFLSGCKRAGAVTQWWRSGESLEAWRG
jgi:hypothetical protein